MNGAILELIEQLTPASRLELFLMAQSFHKPNVNPLLGHYGYIYRITNRITGSQYIGQRRVVKEEAWLDYMGSSHQLSAAIDFFGASCFEKELIELTSDRRHAWDREKVHITELIESGKPAYNYNRKKRLYTAVEHDQQVLEALGLIQ